MKNLVFVLLLITTSAFAQSFWTKEVKAETGILAAEAILDGYTTQYILTTGGGGRELDPLARPFVTHGAAGQAAASAVGIGAVLGTSYLLHRTHHDKLSRWILRVAVIGEGANDVRQVHLYQNWKR